MSRLIVGVNDLATFCPEILDEWNYEENNKFGIYPDKISRSSHLKVCWTCKICGYNWQARISNRVNQGSGCPRCAFAHCTSFKEQAVYYFLKLYFQNNVFNRYVFKDENGKFEADIYLSDYKTAIEYDGKYFHNNEHQCKKDEEKEVRLKKMKIKLIRIIESNKNEIIGNKIYYNYYKNRKNVNFIWAITELLKFFNLGNLFIPIDINKNEIMELFYNSVKKNSLATLYPELAKEWHPTKNGKLSPKYFSPHSNRKIWWLCKHNHKWQATINDRVNGYGCPYCSGRYPIKGINDLATLYPNLVKEWNYEKNGGLKPEMFTRASGIVVWWKCPKCGKEWQKSIHTRTKGYGNCPVCTKRKSPIKNPIYLLPKPGNSLAERFPELVKDWNFKKNSDLTPDTVSYGSGKKVG